MLKKRVITAGCLLPIILAVILYGSTYLVNTVSAIILILAAWEWNQLICIQKKQQNFAAIACLIGVCLVSKWLKVSVVACCVIAAIWWFISFFAIVLYPKGKSFWTNKIVGFFIGWLLFVPTWLALDWLHAADDFGPLWLLFLCCLVWGADVGAYLVGKAWGRKKLVPKISAGKTWLGVAGAFLFAFLVVALFANFWLTASELLVLAILGIIVVVFSIIGDLTESLFKRLRGVKDSGALLPGHGGVLDRIDGLLAAVPTFVVVVVFLQSCKG